MSFEKQSHINSPDTTIYGHQTEISYRVTEPSTPPLDKPYTKGKTFNKCNLRKKVSRLSLAFEKAVSTKADFHPEQTAEHQGVCLIPITINIAFGEQIRALSMKVDKSSTIKLVIQKAIDEYNTLFSKENTKFRIKEDIELFVLKPSKKNGKAKLDMPCFNDEILVCNCYTSNFSLLWKDNPEDVNQMFEWNKAKQQMCKGVCVMF